MASAWTREEDLLLRQLYAAGLPRAEIAAQIGRSTSAVDARRRSLAIARLARFRPWSEVEDRALRAAAAARIPAPELAVRLGRPVEAIWRRRRRLGLASTGPRRYTCSEDETLRAAIAEGRDLASIATELGRSRAALAVRARAMGLVKARSRRRWLPEEDAILRRGYARGLTCAAIGAFLSPPRSASAVAAHARVLGITNYGRRWTSGDDARLRQLLATRVPVERVAWKLVRTPNGIRRRARILGLRVAPVPRARAFERWTEREDAILSAQASSGEATLAMLLARSDVAITRRLEALDLLGARERTPHRATPPTDGLTPAERQLVQREVESGGRRRLFALARRFGCTPAKLNQLAVEEA